MADLAQGILNAIGQGGPAAAGGADNEPFKFNVKVNRKRYRADEEGAIIEDGDTIEYHISKYVEKDRNMYFVKLVAGRLRKKHTELIDIHKREELGPQKIVHINYSYTSDLQGAWADAMEECKLMINSEDRSLNQTYYNSEKFFTNIMLKNESLLVAFSRYVAYLMAESYRRLVMKGNTRFEFQFMEEDKDTLKMDILRALAQVNPTVIRRDLKQDFLPALMMDD